MFLLQIVVIFLQQHSATFRMSVCLWSLDRPTAKPRALTGRRSHRRIHQISSQWLSPPETDCRRCGQTLDAFRKQAGQPNSSSKHFSPTEAALWPCTYYVLHANEFSRRAHYISGVTSAWGSFSLVGLWMGLLITLNLRSCCALFKIRWKSHLQR